MPFLFWSSLAQALNYWCGERGNKDSYKNKRLTRQVFVLQAVQGKVYFLAVTLSKTTRSESDGGQTNVFCEAWSPLKKHAVDTICLRKVALLTQTIDCIQRWVELFWQHPLVLRAPVLFSVLLCIDSQSFCNPLWASQLDKHKMQVIWHFCIGLLFRRIYYL